MKTKIVVRSSVGGKEIQWTGTLQDALDQVQAAYSNPGPGRTGGVILWSENFQKELPLHVCLRLGRVECRA